MRCHYEVLDIASDADDTEIKSAYRKLALKWHPDKNLDNPLEAKEQFQIVQQAYEILSDKQERAWYDAHRDQILRGANSDFEAESLDVFQYFTTSCFKGFGDDDGGFYAVYRHVFEEISKEDLEFMDNKEEFQKIPAFGCSDSNYESVKAFYDYWMSYSTKKSFSWLDPYNIQEGKGDRRLMKLIEKENKKSRMKARKERNEEVRNLVAFVRKRDKRVQAFKKEMEAKAVENRKKHEKISKQKRLERKQMHENETQAEWLKFDNVQSELEEIERSLAREFSDHSDEDDDFNNLYCVACNKVFKTSKAFENHESSKKHRDNVERLKEQMMEEEEEGEKLEEEYGDLKEVCDSLSDNGIGSNDEDSIGCEKDVDVVCGSVQDNGIEDFLNEKGKKKKKKKQKLVTKTESDSSEEVPLQFSDDDNQDFKTSKNQKKKKKDKKSKQVLNDMEEKDEEEEKEKTKKGMKKKSLVPDLVQVSEIDTSHCCVTCKNEFPSKNKLFEHLKKTNHGVYLPSKVKQQNGRKKGKNI